MAKEITIEIDDIHELMFTQLTDELDEDVDLSEWAEDTVKQVLYQAYQNRE